jgi:hypothetical protein
MQEPNKPIWMNQKTKPTIFIATPVHNECSIHYTQSLLKFQQECMVRNIFVSFSLLKSSLVTQGRNLSVSNFLQECNRTNYSHFLFIDSDIEFDFSTIMKMIDADKELIAAPYPLKAIDWAKVYHRVKKEGVMEPDVLSKQGYTWPIKLENRDRITVTEGVAEVTHAPTGCMLIKKQVFDKMIKAYPNLQINQPTIINGQEKTTPYFYNFFDTYHEPETKRYYGEDFGFCKRWTEIGGKCYLYVSDYITHVGEYKYKGRLIDDLQFLKKD